MVEAKNDFFFEIAEKQLVFQASRASTFLNHFAGF
jgi:hypothetical protein